MRSDDYAEGLEKGILIGTQRAINRQKLGLPIAYGAYTVDPSEMTPEDGPWLPPQERVDSDPPIQ